MESIFFLMVNSSALVGLIDCTRKGRRNKVEYKTFSRATEKSVRKPGHEKTTFLTSMSQMKIPGLHRGL